MEETDDIFADLLSGLQPKTPQEPPSEPYVSMEESRRKAVGDAEPEPVRVRRSDSPVGENLTPPPPPLTKEEMQQLIHENVRELMFQNFSALTRTLRTALSSLGEKISTVEGHCCDLNAKVDTLVTKQGQNSENFTESFRHVEAALKEASVGIQRVLEKQDLMDAHVQLNRHVREEQEEKKPRDEEEMPAKKSEKRVTNVRKEPLEETSEEEEEEEEEQEEEEPPPPPARIPHKKKPQPKQQPRPEPPSNYAQEQKTPPVEPEPYVQEKEVVAKHAPPVYAPTQTTPLPRPMPPVPASYAMETVQAQPAPPPPPQQVLPVQQTMTQPRPPQQITPAQPPQQMSPAQPPQQTSFSPGPGSAGYKTPPPPSYDYATHGLGNPNGYAPPPEKPTPPPYPQHMSPASAAPFSGFPPPLLSSQQPPPPMQSGAPGPYTGYPSLSGHQAMYRPDQPPPPPPPQRTIYGSPAAIQATTKQAQRTTSDPTRTGPQSIPLDQVITDVANMGFDRTKVRSVVTNMLDHGEAVDLNVVIDRLMNMRY